MSNKIDFDFRLFNPNFYHIIKYLNDDSLRYIFAYGGSSSSKTYSIVQAIVLLTLQDSKNTLVFRKVSATIKKTVYNDFKTVISSMKLNKYFDILDFKIKCKINNAVIDFTGLDDPEKIKGISSYYRLFFDEITEGELDDFKQLRKRMRGIEGQKFIGTFNPIDEGHWIKQSIYDQLPLINLPTILDNNPLTEVTEVQRASNYIFVKSTYLNNYYVVGSPEGYNFGFKDIQTINDFEQDKILDYNFYRIYALAEWGKLVSGTEFYKQFNRSKHVISDVEVDINLPLHISIDENSRPFLPLTISQVDDKYITVIDEICGKNPHNNITDVIKMFVNKYGSWRDKKVYLYGDATSRKVDARTEKGYNLFGIIYDELTTKHGFKDVVVRVPSCNPSVSQSGRFINMLLANMIEGYSLNINSICLNTINDFLYLKEDKDGKILKERVRNKQDGTTYEKYGHCSDSVRYFIIEYLRDEYNRVNNKNQESEFFTIEIDDNLLAY